jgi:DNA-binding LytR/AlgR family response regulator
LEIKIEEDHVLTDIEITLRCPDESAANVRTLLRMLDIFNGTVIGYKDGKAYKISLRDIFYIESVDNKTFLYLADAVYDTDKRLHTWEKDLTDNNGFVRISKAVILNTAKLISVEPMLGGRWIAHLENGEKQVINRHYVTSFRKNFDV